ncbi:PKD domain-containing protein [Algoriphagus sp. C2-7]|uniref:PKD domain-containing protein n=2 Tax=Algoriphagus sediminis TaxID=3057113 RepID=A0ABT7YCD6_9BACT|nr:PKD domain-containing protein [Algoriphagus sediminis]
MVRNFTGGYLFCIVFLLLSISTIQSHAQVVIPRDGFPYCEPFTGNTTRANTEFGGSPIPASLTSGTSIDPSGQGVLRLTNNDANQTGYVFVDLAFSSAYGIKTSFEYFAYDPAFPNEPGDGFSFFLFDGSIGPLDFEIGGLGGSLGYSPLRYSSGNFGGGYGLKGAFVGIGLDERGNWGNEHEGRFGGFGAPFTYGSGVSPAPFPIGFARYPNAIAIRGPVDVLDAVRDNGMTGMGAGFPATFPQPAPGFRSYPFIDGKILFNNQSDGAPWSSLPASSFLDPSDQFTIGALTRVEDCSDDGYRKVFIDLRPDPSNPGEYTITMDVLVNRGGVPDVINIFNNVPYPYGAPQNLKVGFAASTGATLRSVHEIRNVTVEVSSIDDVLAPDPPNLDETVCFNENLTFDFAVGLPAANQFIRCLQLYENDPGAPDNSPNPAGDPAIGNCGLSGVCVDPCDPANRNLFVPGVGTFESILGELNDQNFNDERDEAEIRFTPEPGFFGTHMIYYTVIDNYGLTSFPRTVTVTVNPTPKADGTAAIIGPTCNGQNDGSISNAILRDLVPGYTFRWEDEFGNVLPASNYSVSETTVGNYIQAEVGVTGVNLGRYFLVVSNPATNNICEDRFQFDVTDERGTPVIVDVDNQQVCFGTDVSFIPRIDPIYGINPSFLWYKDNGKTQPITDGLTEGAVTYSIDSNGVLTISGLPENATPFEYFVEVAADPSQNLCATPPGNLKQVQALIVPPLGLAANVVDDLCYQAAGSITVNASGGFGSYEYSLDGGPFQTSNVFSGLLPGTYTIDVNAGTNCVGTITETIAGPAAALNANLIDTILPSCGLDNGEMVIEVSGGTPAYNITLNGQPISNFTVSENSGTYTISDIPPAADYDIVITDQNNCQVSIPDVPFAAIPVPSFDVNNDLVCPGGSATLTPQIIELSNAANLVYIWEDENGNTISNGTSNGVTYTINAGTGELNIVGLPERVNPYEFNLFITGDNLCSTDPLVSEVAIRPSPAIDRADVVDVTCFGDNSGEIELVPVDPAAAAEYEYSIDGGITFQPSNVFSGLVAGTYDFVIRNSVSLCTSNFDGVVITEPTELISNLDDVIQPACGESNGLIEISFGGGTGPYFLEVFFNGGATPLLSQANVTSPFTIQDLAPGDYSLQISDANSCLLEVSQQLIDDAGIPITVDPMSSEICEGDISILTPIVNTSGNPNLTWYKDAAATDQIVSSPNPDSDGVTYTIDPGTLELTLDGLAAGNYTYYLVAEGPGYCPNPPFEATVTVYEPLLADAVVTNEICFGAVDGTITVSATGADGNYEYSLDGGAFGPSNQFTGLAPGTYSIDIQSGNGCTYTFDATVQGPNAAIQATADILRSSCSEANGSIENLNITGGWGDYSIEWRRGSITGAVVPGDLSGAQDLLPDTYFAIITDLEGCEAVFDFVVEEQPLPNYEVTTFESCFGSDATLTPVNTQSGSSPSEIFWYKDAGLTQPISDGVDQDDPSISYSISANGELTISGLPGSVNPYNYYLNVICGNQVVEATVIINPLPDPDFEIVDALCFGDSNGTISLAASSSAEYGNTNYTFTIIQTGESNNSGEFNTLAEGDYDIRIVNDLTTCESTQSFTIGQPDELIISNEQFQSPVCEPDNGFIYWEISGGTEAYSYELTESGNPITGFTVTASGSGFEILGLPGGDYTLTAIDANGCQTSVDYSLVVQVAPEFMVTNDEICEGEVAELTPEIVELGVPISSPTFAWYLDAQGTQMISNGQNDPSLPGVSYNLSASGVLSIVGLPTDSNPYVYYLGVEGPNTCDQALIPAEVMVNPIPDVEFVTEPEQCFGAADGRILVTSGGSADFEYNVVGIGIFNQSQLEANDFAPGTYQIEITNIATTCFESFEVIIEGPTAPLEMTPLEVIDPGCGADVGIIRTEVTGGWAPYTINVIKDGSEILSLVSADSEIEINDLAPGDYYLEVVDDQGCTITSETVTLVYGPSQVLVDDVEICEGEIAVLTPEVNPSVASPVFEWFYDAALTNPLVSSANPDANGHIIQIDADGVLSVEGIDSNDSPVSYYVTVSGNGVCPGFIANPTLEIFDQPSLSFNVVDEVCFGEQGTINFTATGGSGTYEYSLDGVNYQSSNVFNVAPGTYDGYVRSGGCEGLVSGIVVDGPSTPINVNDQVSTDPVCNSDNGSISFTIAGGYGGYSVTTFINGQNNGTVNLTDGNFELNDLGPGDYTFEIVDQGGCVFEVSEPLVLTEQLTPLETTNDEICEGETGTVTANSSQPGITPVFTWYFDAAGTQPVPNGTQGNVTYQIAADGTMNVEGLTGSATSYTYYVGISGQGTCPPPLVPATIQVSAIPNLRVSNPSIVCDPQGTVDLTQFIEGYNPNAFDYLIESPTGAILRQDQIQDVDQNGDYRVQSSVKDRECWSQVQRIQVLIADEELIPEFNYEIDLGGGNIIVNGEIQILEPVQFDDISQGDVIIWNWDFGDGNTSASQNPVHEYDKKGIYTVTLTTIDKFGCVAEFQRVVEVFDDYMIMVPNAFTPDGAKNQYFKPQFRGIASMEFYVFSTWGELIYQTNSLEALGWDGSLNGTPAMNGNYVYRAVFMTRSGEKVEKAGVFVLIR